MKQKIVALNIPDLEKKLLASVRSLAKPLAKPLTNADFNRIRVRTRKKLKRRN